MKSTIAEIRARFDADVERFSNLETGQSATMDAPLALELISEAAVSTTPGAKHLLDVGCGAGNFSLRLLQRLPNLAITLVDLSQPMLTRAEQRLRAVGTTSITTIQNDIRATALEPESFDIILAAAVLHHLRTDDEWQTVFAAFFTALAPGGSLWIFDLVDVAIPALRLPVQRRYGHYLESLKGPTYRDEVFAYIEREDTPRSLPYQLELLRSVGFHSVEVIHKQCCFAAFGAVK